MIYQRWNKPVWRLQVGRYAAESKSLWQCIKSLISLLYETLHSKIFLNSKVVPLKKFQRRSCSTPGEEATALGVLRRNKTN